MTPRRRTGGHREASERLRKASEFAEGARQLLDSGLLNAAAGLAVTAGIAAADSIGLAVVGRHSTGQDHRAAAQLLAAAGEAGRRAAPILGRLLDAKDKAQYDVRAVTRKEAEDAVKRAEALLDLARRTLAR